MKISKCVFAATLLSVTASANAQQDELESYDRVTFTGDVVTSTPYDPSRLGRFTATVYYDAANVTGDLDNSPLIYDAVVRVFSWEVYNNDGYALFGGGIIFKDEEAEPSYMRVDTSSEGQTIEWFNSTIISPRDTSSIPYDMTTKITFKATDTPIVSTVNNIIKLHDGPIAADFTYTTYSEEFGYYRGITAITDNVTVHRVDQDFDGIGLGDECEASIIGGTVSINGIETGVENGMASNGCSIMDEYAACHADQGQGGMMFGGYRGPSYCEQQVAYSAYREGLIDYTEVRMLRLALMR